MKTRNLYADLVFKVWYFIKKASVAIVSVIPAKRIYIKKNRTSKIFIRDDEFSNIPEKHHHQPTSKPVVEKQTLLRETKKQKRQDHKPGFNS
jgi:hypothetical protein